MRRFSQGLEAQASEKFRVPGFELQGASWVELDVNKCCEVGEAYSSPSWKSIVIRAQQMRSFWRLMCSLARGGLAFEALISHVAGEF